MEKTNGILLREQRVRGYNVWGRNDATRRGIRKEIVDHERSNDFISNKVVVDDDILYHLMDVKALKEARNLFARISCQEANTHRRQGVLPMSKSGTYCMRLQS